MRATVYDTTIFGDRRYCAYVDDGTGELRLAQYTVGEPTALAFPDGATSQLIYADPDDGGVALLVDTMTRRAVVVFVKDAELHVTYSPDGLSWTTPVKLT